MTNNWSTHYLPPSVLRPSLVALAIALATATMVRAGSVTISNSGPGPAAELDPATRSILEVKDAIKSFEKRDFDGCLKQLVKARAAHPELPPPHALLAKLAFLANQGPLIRPALESAIGEDPEHPEIFILFGNLALAEAPGDRRRGALRKGQNTRGRETMDRRTEEPLRPLRLSR